MVKRITRPLALGYAAETKVGKSHLGAMFAKQFGGIVFDFSRIFMQGGFSGETPTYQTAQKAPQVIGEDEIVEVGEAFPACENVGLDTENCYKLILKWDDFKNAVEFARIYRDDILEQQKLWIVLDDMVGLRWHKVIDISLNAVDKNGNKKPHKSVSKDDWKVASTDMKLLISQLSKEFNLLMINQMSAQYDSGEKTGERDPNWIPGGAEYLYDGLFFLKIDETTKPKKQYAELIAGRNIWQCSEDFAERIDNPKPEDILTALNIKEDRW